MRSEPADGTRADGTDPLPAIVRVRTQATVAGHDAVVIRFANGARLRYVSTGETVREEWVAPDATTPTRTAERTPPLREAALNAVGEYLSFDDRAHAAFVWGTEHVDVVTE